MIYTKGGHSFGGFGYEADAKSLHGLFIQTLAFFTEMNVYNVKRPLVSHRSGHKI